MLVNRWKRFSVSIRSWYLAAFGLVEPDHFDPTEGGADLLIQADPDHLGQYSASAHDVVHATSDQGT